MDRPAGALSRRNMLLWTAAAAAGLAGCRSGHPVPPLPADLIVFTVSSTTVNAPVVTAALQAPSLVVYGDGRILTVSDRAAAPVPTPSTVPTSYTVAETDPTAVATFVDETKRSGLLERDYGDLRISDQGSTTVSLHGAGDTQQVRVYGLSSDNDEYASWLDRWQRRRLRDLIDDARSLGGSTTPYQPERVVVIEQQPPTGATALLTWPGPDPATFLHPAATEARGAIACGELTGEDATVAYEAARSNSGQEWLVGGRTRVLAVNPLPVEIDC